MNVQRAERRERAAKRLEEQLKLGTKPDKGESNELIPLTDFDIKRIKNELKTLNKK